jgi:hemerythrin
LWAGRITQIKESGEKLTTLEWIEMNRVGDLKVGGEHHEWFQLANNFLFADNLREKDEAGKSFLQFTFRHFACEETKMIDTHFPFIASHVDEHERLFRTLKKILEVTEDFALSKNELEEYMGYCLTRHISQFDDHLDLFIRRKELF